MRTTLAIVLFVLAAAPAGARASSWQTRCDRHGRCRVEVRGHTVVRAPARGPIVCVAHSRWLACTWRHATQLHVSEGWFVDLHVRRVHRMRPITGAHPDGSFDQLEGEPIWEDAGIALRVIASEGSAQTVHRAPPGWFRDLDAVHRACVGADTRASIDVVSCSDYLHRSPRSSSTGSTVVSERADAMRRCTAQVTSRTCPRGCAPRALVRSIDAGAPASRWTSTLHDRS